MHKFTFGHIRLWISLLVGMATFFAVPHSWSLISRELVAYNCAVVLFLVLIYTWMLRLSWTQICDQFIEEDETAPFILAACILAALASQVAIVALLSHLSATSGIERPAHEALAALTVVNSWILVATMFTLHYADQFYSVIGGQPPLAFPATTHPVFWDFVYFSFTIAAACQTSDVATTNVAIRKVVAIHSVISFLFNAAILGFAINVTAGLLSSN